MIKLIGDNNTVENYELLNSLDNLQISIFGDNNSMIWTEPDLSTKSGLFNISVEGNNNKIILNGKISIDQMLVICVVDDEHIIKIDRNCSFVSTVISCADNGSLVDIGEDCMFSNGVTIMPSDFHSIIDINTNKRINYAQDINIGRKVWVGMEAMILKGGGVGDNSIIGAKSVVVSYIDPYSIAVGVPAKIVKKDVVWERERRPREFRQPLNDDFKTILHNSIEFNLEFFDRNLSNRMIEGWMFVKNINNINRTCWVRVTFKEGHKVLERTIFVYTYARKDVEMFFENSIYLYSGFRMYIPFDIQDIIKMQAFIKVGTDIYDKIIYE